MTDLRGKHVIVTGGSQGIGAAIAVTVGTPLPAGHGSR